ncbi:hypothetical protein NP233_g8835 [Leucocoprinus birnbaumii]|uniref:Uncharacterized protein n=1 Tax=Leucocoprinus birnbaumii TaxID=56174 RepID=A0AAD5VP02_9AGAR|nr:hypothetical protein NP233_g8835 [Leucocoprinus birnbaumii]
MNHPDIAYAVFYLGRFNHNPHPEHWTAVKHLLQYLKGTRNYKLVYKGSDRLLYSISPLSLSLLLAEYVAAVEDGKEIVWMRNILTEFGFSPSYASTFFIDNKSGIDVSKNPEHHGRMKHLDLRFYWLRDAVQAATISPVYVPTAENVADLFTKAVQPQVVEFAVPMLGLSS